MKLTIGEKIAMLRKEKDITQTELAEYLFVTPQTVSRWEVGSGAPEITLLPRIAAFFDISIDELFGLTSLKRVEDLVCKYSVLRDDRSFREAMDCIDSQLQTVDALLKNGAEDRAGLERDRDQLEGEKMHMWIQQGREAFHRAFEIADSFVRKTEGHPEHPWYLPMRLQRDQLCRHLGKYRQTLAERKRELAEHPDAVTLQRYLYMLSDAQDYEAVLSTPETEGGNILFPPSEKNAGAWLALIHAAVETGRTDFVERHLPPVLEVCSGEEEFDLLMYLLDLYRNNGQREKLAAVKERLLALLPGRSRNQYFEENTKKRIEQS